MDRCKRCKERHTDFCAQHSEQKNLPSQHSDCKIAMCITCNEFSCRKHMYMLTIEKLGVTIQICWRCASEDARLLYKYRREMAKDLGAAFLILEAEMEGRAVTKEERDEYRTDSSSDL